jgi:DNA-binding LacI/PurR family transcriptional regulator
VRVPEDISVAGMSGFADMSPPHRLLTTIADDYRRLGREAGELLLRRINGDPTLHVDRPERRILPAELRPAETTGPAPR